MADYHESFDHGPMNGPIYDVNVVAEEDSYNKIASKAGSLRWG